MNTRNYRINPQPGTAPPGEAPHGDIHRKVTERILELLEQGVTPWEPSHFARVGFPRNFRTGGFYQGINVFLLGMQRYASPYWLTYRQASELGGFVRKGEKSTLVVKFGTHPKPDQEGDSAGDGQTAKPRGYLRLYSVFNATQIQGIDFPQPEEHPERRKPGPGDDVELEPVEAAEKVLREMPLPPEIHIGRHDHPFYDPRKDTVEVPARKAFRSEAGFYNTLFHELAHATGHQSRLGRATLMGAGTTGSPDEQTKNYGREELIAEMAASFLCAHVGFGTELEDSAAYLQGWLRVLKAEENHRWIISAASQAQRASDFILARISSARKYPVQARDPGHPEYLPDDCPGGTRPRPAAGNVHMRTYVKDPYWLKAKFSSSCSKCGVPIQKGDDIFYIPNGKKVFCHEDVCGGQASRDFEAAASDEDAAGGGRYRRNQQSQIGL